MTNSVKLFFQRFTIRFPKFLSLLFVLLFSLFLFTSCDAIINLMAFHPDTQDVLSAERIPSNVEEIFLETEDNLKIQSYYLRYKTSDRLLIYFHGNAGNIGQRVYDLMRIRSFGINVLGLSYRGYGKSDGKPSETGLYIDGKTAIEYSIQKLGFPINNIYIMGRSIGSTVAVHSAQNLNYAGLILVSPLTSGKAQAKTTNLSSVAFLAGDAFNNIAKIKNIKCPVLIIHGSKDTIIPFSMGEEIYDAITTTKKLVKIEGAGHNDLSTEYYELYWAPIKSFLQH